MIRRMTSVFAAAIVWCLCCCALAGQARAEIKMGILPRLNAVELFTMFDPLAAYLSRATGERVTIVIPKDFEAFKKAVERGELDIGFANPLIYIQLRSGRPLEPLAVASEGKSGTRFRGVMIAARNSGIRNIGDLRGKKVVFVDHDSAAGYIFQVLLLQRSGLDIHRDLELLPFAKKHDNVVMAVMNGVADAGGLRESDFEMLREKQGLRRLKVIAATDFFPNWPVFAVSTARRETNEKIRTALLKLRPGTPEAAAVVHAAQLAGFAAVTDKEYDGLRQAARLAGAF